MRRNTTKKKSMRTETEFYGAFGGKTGDNGSMMTEEDENGGAKVIIFIFHISNWGGQVGSKKTETDNEKLEESNNFSDNQTKVTIEHSKNGFHLPEIDRGKHKKGKNSWIIFYYFVCFLLKTFSVFFSEPQRRWCSFHEAKNVYRFNISEPGLTHTHTHTLIMYGLARYSLTHMHSMIFFVLIWLKHDFCFFFFNFG